MTSGKVEMIFRQNDSDGQTALRFIVGLGIILAAIWMWWHGWFSGLVVENGMASDALESSYRDREVSLQSTGHEPVGSTGALSIVFDMIVLVGIAGISVWRLMWQGFSLAWNGGKHIVQGMYANADASQTAVDPASGLSVLDSIEAQIETLAESTRIAISNQELRMRALESGPIAAASLGTGEYDPQVSYTTQDTVIDVLKNEIRELKDQLEIERARKPSDTTTEEKDA